MNLHKQITEEMQRQYDALQDAIIVYPSAIAMRVFEVFSSGEEAAHIEYASLEHLKHMARVFLAKKKNPDSDESEAYSAQDEMDFGAEFSGQLQDRYPLPRKAGEEPAYKKRHDLTPEERAWNVKQLRKSAGARLEHADALEAEGQYMESKDNIA
jgi:hypothetical protein